MSSFVELAGCLGGLRGRGRPPAHGVRGPRAGGPLRVLATPRGQLLRALAPVDDLTRAASWLHGHLSCLRQALRLLAGSTRLAFSTTVSFALVPFWLSTTPYIFFFMCFSALVFSRLSRCVLVTPGPVVSRLNFNAQFSKRVTSQSWQQLLGTSREAFAPVEQATRPTTTVQVARIAPAAEGAPPARRPSGQEPGHGIPMEYK